MGELTFRGEPGAGANAPLPVHAGWILSQMMRWAHIPADVDIPALAHTVYRPDLYAIAMSALGLPAPAIPDVLAGYAEGSDYRLSDAVAHAHYARLSRVDRA